MKRVKEFLGKDGHCYVTLFKNGVGSNHRVCDLVWTSFKGEIPNGYFVSHIDGNKTNNALVNLQLVKDGSNLS